MKERRRKNWWCGECREFWAEETKRQKKKRDPPCEQCGWPGVTEGNFEAWMVFQLVCGEAWGITASNVIAVCQMKGIDDVEDCLDKVMDLSAKSKDDEPIAPAKG